MVKTLEILVLTLSLAALATAGLITAPSKAYLSKIKHSSSRKARGVCSAQVQTFPLNHLRVQQADDDTSKEARSLYSAFSIQKYYIHGSNGRPEWSEFHIAIEHKSPELQYINERRIKANFYNLLFTASLKISMLDTHCQGNEFSQVGFVELVETDVVWYRTSQNVIEYMEQNLANHGSPQYVISKQVPQSTSLFANNTSWGRTVVGPKPQDYMVPLKYESSENIIIDFVLHPYTKAYERLIEKKIFLVRTNLRNEVLQVVSGVDVMIYVHLNTYNVTDNPNMDIVKHHGLIQHIANPQKYAAVITKLQNKGTSVVRQTELQYEDSISSSNSITTLNPLPKSMRIITG